MIENMLTRALRLLVTDAVDDILYPAPDGTEKKPLVIDGFLPAKRDGRDDFPFVLIRPASGSMEDETATVEVSLIVGAWSEDFAGYRIALDIMSRIRNALLMLPNRTMDGRFQLDGSVDWELPDEQPYPGWTITISTSWVIRAPEILSDEERKVYGYFE